MNCKSIATINGRETDVETLPKEDKKRFATEQEKRASESMKQGGETKTPIYRNIVTINEKEVELETLPKEEKERLAREWNRTAARKLNYIEDKTA